MTIRKMIGAAALMGVMASANAASISLVYTGGASLGTDTDGAALAAVGDVLSFDIVADFTDQPTIGGGWDIAFNSDAFAYGEYTLDPTGLGPGVLDPGFSSAPCTTTTCEDPGVLLSAAFGNFNGYGLDAVVASITFTAVAEGDINFVLSDNILPAGSFIDAATFAEIAVDYSNQATARVVPVPAAVWFMLSGLGALVGFGRRKAA